MSEPGPLKLTQYKAAVYRITLTGLNINYVASYNVWTITLSYQRL